MGCHCLLRKSILRQHNLTLHICSMRIKVAWLFLRNRRLRKFPCCLPLSCLNNLDKGPVPGTEQSSEICAKNMGWVWWGNRGNTRVQPVSHCFCIAQKTFVYQHLLFHTGLEKVRFHSNPKERQCQRMLKLLHNCTHLTC